jgi:hypothetical protein
VFNPATIPPLSPASCPPCTTRSPPRHPPPAQELDEEDTQLQFACVDVVCKCIKVHGADYAPVFADQVAEVLASLTREGMFAADQGIAAVVVVDAWETLVPAGVVPQPLMVADASGARVPSGDPVPASYVDAYMPFMLRSLAIPHDQLRQAAGYGLGVAAQRCPELAMPWLPAMVGGLTAALAAPPEGCRRGTPDDNLVISLGKIAAYMYGRVGHPGPPLAADAPPRSEVMTQFLLHSPLKHDVEECGNATQLLCTLLDDRDPDILGADAGEGEYDLLRLVHALHCLAHGVRTATLARHVLKTRVTDTLARLRSGLPGEVMAAVWGELKADDRQVFLQLVSGA